MKTYYPGHPFLDDEYKRDENNLFLEEHNLKNDDSLLVLLPGSRQQEINNHWPIFFRNHLFIEK